MAHDVFISHSKKDKTVADAVCGTLEKQGIRCWIAPRDVSPGQSWPAAIVEAISNSKVFVLVFSDGSNQSKQVVKEVGEAFDNGIPIVPLRIDDVKPSQEMGYYIKSIHWLDAMTPPMESHLDKLAESVEALLSVGEEDPPQETEIQVTLPSKKQKFFPVWAIGLIGLASVIVLGVVGLWIVPRLNSAPSSPTSTTVALVADPSDIPNPEPTPSPEASSEPGWSDWKTLSFNIPSETLWRQSGENSYTIIANPSSDTIAWSDEIITGDFILTAEVTHASRRGAAMFIVYGDGIGFSYGCLMVHYGSTTDGNGWAAFEAHSIYEDGNLLVGKFGDFYLYEAARVITIEIAGGEANLYADGQKVASVFLPSEINHAGRIGIVQHWEQPVGATYSNIRIKTMGDDK